MSLATGRPDVKFRSLRGATDYEVFVAKFPLRLVPKLWGFCRESPPFGPVRGASEPSDPPYKVFVAKLFPIVSQWVTGSPSGSPILLAEFRDKYLTAPAARSHPASRIPEDSGAVTDFRDKYLIVRGVNYEVFVAKFPRASAPPSPGMRYLSRNSPNPTFATNTL